MVFVKMEEVKTRAALDVNMRNYYMYDGRDDKTLFCEFKSIMVFQTQTQSQTSHETTKT